MGYGMSVSIAVILCCFQLSAVFCTRRLDPNQVSNNIFEDYKPFYEHLYKEKVEPFSRGVMYLQPWKCYKVKLMCSRAREYNCKSADGSSDGKQLQCDFHCRQCHMCYQPMKELVKAVGVKLSHNYIRTFHCGSCQLQHECDATSRDTCHKAPALLQRAEDKCRIYAKDDAQSDKSASS